MIIKNKYEPLEINLGKRKVKQILLGDRLIWQNNAEYITLPYIVSNGNSWADTGLYLDPTIHRVQGSFIVDDLSMVSAYDIYVMEGARTSSVSGVTKVNTHIRKLSSTTYEIRRDWGILSNIGQYDGIIYEVGKEYTFDYTPEYTEINGLRIERTAESNGLCKHSYYIGKSNDPVGIPISYVPPGVRATKRIFSLYATGEIIGESIPVLNKSDNTFNYFDKVSEKYLENKGSEPFTGAYEAWVYQMGRPLSYLRSNGNQWIDTKFIIPEGLNYQIETNLRKSPNTGTQFLYGAGASSSSVDNIGVYVTQNNDYLFVIKRKDVANDTSIKGDQLNNFTLLTQNKNGGVFGEIPYTLQELRDVYPPYSFYLFAINRGGVATLPSNELEVSFWRVRDLDNDTYAINLIPFITWEGIRGYLNLVNRELLLNQGTGEFEVPTVPVYAINWKDETFDPITGKVAEIGTGYTSPLLWNDWTDAQKDTFRGKKMVCSWKADFTNAEFASLREVIGCNARINYTDGTNTPIYLNQFVETLVNGLTSPYNRQGASYAVSVQIEDKEIESIVLYQGYFNLPRVRSGELKAYDIKWEVDVPEWEIDAIESLNASGIAAFADHQDNINMLNQIGIK